MTRDPVASNPEHYSVLFENDRVRVLEYSDTPGDATTPHSHPDSVMVTLSAFTRRLSAEATTTGIGPTLDVELPAGAARWLPAQTHSGENIGTTPTHTIFVELKGEHPLPAQTTDDPPLGPDAG
ncbi:cytoplasmic protein [Cryobacterium melibiosiphilum]|uniref:Cytoplasmic protein n=1 Tax=Cryobacterium melibiosiphilum TaxID=995039 RepID=A0A3A5M9I9_9MICO|nr:cytoplasmic protein [Cryobacterium melibiosiphilum]RJT86235.1 cytoplasmic protein [Cryobacterium melibiosiphilum]